MENTLTYLSLIALFKFPFEGKQWQRNFLIGALVIFAGFYIPVIPWVFVTGYVLSIMKCAMENDRLVLPSWDDVSKLWIDGLRGGLISLVYTLPGSLILLGGMGIYFITSMLVPIMMEMGHWHMRTLSVIFPVFMVISIGILTLSMFFGMLLLMVGSFSLPLALSHFVAEDRLAAAFHIRKWLKILRKNKWGYFVTWVLVSGVTVILYTIITLMYYSVALCCLIPWVLPPVMLYTLAIYAALFGQIYRETTRDKS